VTVLAVSDGKVKLGFEVDTRTPVHRAEVWEKCVGGQLARDDAGTTGHSSGKA
jgi:sRNA-binding carbon storage regulator CsrA